MKKQLIFILSAALLTACSSTEEEGQQGQETSAERISISAAASASLNTRATGTVGGVSTASGSVKDNVWNGQTVNIFMFNRGTVSLALNPTTGAALFNNVAFTTPTNAQEGMATPQDGSIRYYPVQGVFDFWGCHLDDAATGEPVMGDSVVSIPISINGTQDLMLAKAVPSAEETSRLEADSCYSARYAREGIQPMLTFQHQLTRLTFSIDGFSSDVCDSVKGVSIDSIKVVSPYKGRLIVANIAGDGYADFDAETDSISLMERAEGAGANTALQKLTPIKPEWNFADTTSANPRGSSIKTPVGEAMMLPPSKELVFIIFCSQMVQARHSLENELRKEMWTYVTPAITTKTGSFEKGKSYNINIKVYGLQQIKVNTTLEPWVQGEDINVSEDDED